MADIAITSLSPVTANPTAHGNTEVARFVCQIGGIRLTGVRLMRMPNGGHFAQAPIRSKGKGTPSIAATITDPNLMQAIVDAAIARLATAGTDAPDEGHRHRAVRRRP
nr:hypothetical protein NG677_04290 [Methylobacterium sp. OTU13CASTA1]